MSGGKLPSADASLLSKGGNVGLKKKEAKLKDAHQRRLGKVSKRSVIQIAMRGGNTERNEPLIERAERRGTKESSQMKVKMEPVEYTSKGEHKRFSLIENDRESDSPANLFCFVFNPSDANLLAFQLHTILWG